jgi:hypothetical protein
LQGEIVLELSDGSWPLMIGDGTPIRPRETNSRRSSGRAAGFRSPLLIGPILVGLLLLIGFVRREQRTISPLIDLGLFRNAVFVAGNVAGLLSYAILFGAFSRCLLPLSGHMATRR